LKFDLTETEDSNDDEISSTDEELLLSEMSKCIPSQMESTLKALQLSYGILTTESELNPHTNLPSSLS